MSGANGRIVDITDVGQVLGVAAGCDAVIHCAAIPSPERHPPEVIFETNVIGTFAVLQAAAIAGISRVVISSSLSALGGAWATPPHPPRYVPVDEDHPLEVEDPYGLSKVINERTAEMFHRRYGMTIAALRFGWILSGQEARAEAERFARRPPPQSIRTLELCRRARRRRSLPQRYRRSRFRFRHPEHHRL